MVSWVRYILFKGNPTDLQVEKLKCLDLKLDF